MHDAFGSLLIVPYIIIFLFASFVLYLLLFRVFYLLSCYKRTFANLLKKERSVTISDLLYKDEHLTDLEKQTIYENIENEDRFELALHAFSLRQNNLMPYIDIILLFTKNKFFLLPVHKAFILPWIELYYGDITDIRFRKGFITDKLKITSGKDKFKLMLHKRFPEINNNIEDHLRNKAAWKA